MKRLQLIDQNQLTILTGIFIFLFFCTTFFSAILQAKEAEQPVTVKSRARPAFDPLGVHVSSFTVIPKLSVSEQYSDNLYASDKDEESDFITVIRPELIVKSNWNNHALSLRSSASIQQHITNNSENSEDFSVSGKGHVDILRSSRLSAGAGFKRDHKRRSSADDVAGLDPTVFHETTAFSFYEHDLNPLSVKAGVRFSRKDFDDVMTSTGTIINNDDRDRNRLEGELQINYEISPRFSTFVLGTINSRDYDNLSDGLGLDRSSKGYEISLGSKFYGSEVMFGELSVGFKEQTYEDRRLKTIDGITGGGSITWQPSGLTTLNLASSRSINETTVDTASGIFESKVELDIDHELLRNLLLNLNLSFLHHDFEGIKREDKYFNVGFGVSYLMNRYINFKLNYDYTARDSNLSDTDFIRNTVSFMINAQL